MTFHDLDERPDCGGTVLEHVDGTDSDCSRRDRCTGGAHTQAEECVSAPEQCAYCLTLRCGHDVIEHVNGVEECSQLGAQCRGVWHDGGFLGCAEVLGDDHVCPSRRPGAGPAVTVTWSLPPAHP